MNCSVEGCAADAAHNGMCVRHYQQMRKHGKILKRTVFDRNEIREFQDYAEMDLYDRNGTVLACTKIDLEDIQKIKDIKWCLRPPNLREGHVFGHVGGGKHESLHRFLMSPRKGDDIDHINRDKLDNRKDNLRFATRRQNVINRGPRSDSRTGVKGVSKSKKGYIATVSSRGICVTFGPFETIQEAAIAYDREAYREFGEFAYLNSTNMESSCSDQ